MARSVKKDNVKLIKKQLENIYLKKYKALFMTLCKITGGDYREGDYIMSKFYEGKSLGSYNLNTNPEVKVVAFGEYVPYGYNRYGYPLKYQIINEYNDPYVPKKQLKNGIDGALMVPDINPLEIVLQYVRQLIDIDMTIRTNVKLHKVPFIVKSEDDLDVVEQILNDEEYVVSSNDLTLDAVQTGVPYIIDKLFNYRNDKESELLTLLGIDNVKHSKPAQQNNPEIEANDQEITQFKNILVTKLEEWFKEVNAIHGTNYAVEVPVTETEEDPLDPEKDKGDADDETRKE